MLMRYLLPSILLLGLSLRVNAQSFVSPGLGVPGNSSETDVQEPTTTSPCDNVSIVSVVDNSTTVQANANGDVTANIKNFAIGVSGSRAVTAQIDSGGSGQSFMPAAVTTNGDGEPISTGIQSLVLQIPPSTLCTGGKEERRRLLAFKTAGGYGNCVVMTQPNGAATSPTNPALPASYADTRCHMFVLISHFWQPAFSSTAVPAAPAIGKRGKPATPRRAPTGDPAILKRGYYPRK